VPPWHNEIMFISSARFVF